MTIQKTTPAEIILGAQPLTIEDVVCLAHKRAVPVLSNAPQFKAAVDASYHCVHQMLQEQGSIYGVTSGYGDSCDRVVPNHLISQLPTNLVRFHGCGMGAYFSNEITRAIIVCRLLCLVQGHSGVSYTLLNALCALLIKDVLPCIPQEGSVGASGDLTPLSYVAAVLMGERKASYQAQKMPAQEALSLAGLTPYQFLPKEALAMMNGTSVMTALCALSFYRAQRLVNFASVVSAMNVLAIGAHTSHFDQTLFALKPHRGQELVATLMREELKRDTSVGKRLQYQYSIRCAPHIIGVLQDALIWMRPWIETEMNSVNDNPVVDAVEHRMLHGGHFYGGHMAFVADALKTAVANVADLLDRQCALLVDPKTNQGLPANLSGAPKEELPIHHGFKAMQITTSALAAEALKLCMPASVFSRSTESHNQDKVSMGTIAARDAWRVIELCEQVLAVNILVSIQALRLRFDQGLVSMQMLGDRAQRLWNFITPQYPMVVHDRALDETLQMVLACIRDDALDVSL